MEVEVDGNKEAWIFVPDSLSGHLGAEKTLLHRNNAPTGAARTGAVWLAPPPLLSLLVSSAPGGSKDGDDTDPRDSARASSLLHSQILSVDELTPGSSLPTVRSRFPC